MLFVFLFFEINSNSFFNFFAAPFSLVKTKGKEERIDDEEKMKAKLKEN